MEGIKRQGSDKTMRSRNDEKVEAWSAEVAVIPEVTDPDAHLFEDERRLVDRKLVRKCDLRLIPWLCLIYLLCFLDRTNIGNARLAGMEKDLNMKGHDYNIALTIFFVSYAGAEPFTNLILKKVTPRVFFTSTVFIWGVCMMCMGFVHNYAGLLAARWFLGITEAGLFPGVHYYLSCWYKRSELGLRLAVFFANAALAGSFGGLLAAAIAKMDGIAGKSGWAWIFIIEGLATVVVGLVSWWMVFDWPETATFLSDEDRVRVRLRLAKDKLSSEGSEYHKRHVVAALKDWKCWAYCVTEMGSFMPLYAFSLFLPTILAGMGYEGTRAQLLSVPPYALAAVMTIVVGWVADQTRQRGICNMITVGFAIAGFMILLVSENPNMQYAGTFLGAMGIYPTIPNNLSYCANNVEGPYKRGVLLGVVVGWGNLNGIVSSNIYLKSEKPGYKTGHAVVLSYLIICQFMGTSFIRTMLARENKKRSAGERDSLPDDAEGDQRPDFVYTL